MDLMSLGAAAAALLKSRFNDRVGADLSGSARFAVARIREIVLLEEVVEESESGVLGPIEVGEAVVVVAARICEAARQDRRMAAQLARWISVARRDMSADRVIVEALDRAGLSDAVHAGSRSPQPGVRGVNLGFRASEASRQVNVVGDNTGTINSTTVHEAPLPPRPIMTSTLRRDVSTFIGRERELERILSAMAPGRVLSIHTLDGMPGVGKTALVTRAAHVLADRFPDGRYFIDLHAHTPGRAPDDPSDVLAGLLVGLGVDPRNLPEDLDGLSSLWRDRLAHKRALLVLDDAADVDQVEPLIPAGQGCLTLVTSRRRLMALDGAMPFTLGMLEPDHARLLFVTLARRGPNAYDDAAVARIVHLCGYLPLAIVLLAGRLAHHPAWTVTALAREFEAAGDRLAEFDVGSRAVRAAFGMSYRNLPPERQRFFRCLGLHPGPDVDAPAAAALADVSIAVARAELEALYIDHLLEETTQGRYTLHDLLRDYARALCDTDPREARNRALERLLDYYQSMAAAADRYLANSTRPVPPPSTLPEQKVAVSGFGHEVEALSWMRAERANLLACIEHTTHHQPMRTATLTAMLAGLLERDGPWPQAADLHRRAATTAHEIGDVLGEANALDNLGMLREFTGEFAESVELHRQALSLYRAIGNRLGEANALSNIGTVRQTAGEFITAAELLNQALPIYREVGSRLGEANTLTLLGVVAQLTGDYTGGTDLHEQALALYRDISNWQGEATSLMILGLARMWTGDITQAETLLERALEIHRQIGNRLGEANSLTILGIVRQLTQDLVAAGDFLERGLGIHREIGNRLGEANTLNKLGSVHRATGNFSEAAELHRNALILVREIGNPLGEAEVLNETGKLLLETAAPQAAVHTFTDALDVACRIQSQLEQARALEGSARGRAALGDTRTAITQLREAVHLYQRLSSPELDPAAAYLATLEQHSTPLPDPVTDAVEQ